MFYIIGIERILSDNVITLTDLISYILILYLHTSITVEFFHQTELVEKDLQILCNYYIFFF